MTGQADTTRTTPLGTTRSLPGLGRLLPRRSSSSGRGSLARRFLAANLVILLVAGVVVGIWVGDQLERGIVERTASVTALYVESIIEPIVESMADDPSLTPGEIDELDGHLARGVLGERLVSLRIWSPDGEVVYSTTPKIIGRRFPVADGLASAWAGEVSVKMDDLQGEENAWERGRWDRLLEMYIPVRERGTDRIIAVSEFYQDPAEIDRQVGEARLTSWIVVSLAIAASAALVFGIVKQGSDTIDRQEAALTRQVDDLTVLLDRNAALNERVRSAAERTTTLNERSLRRISSDLHDGPAQMLSLALLRLDALRVRRSAGQDIDPGELASLEAVLQEAMADMRAVAAGLRLPELEDMDVPAAAMRAVTDHARHSGVHVELSLEGAPAQAPLPVRIALFRALQEALSNATRHGQGASIRVAVGGQVDDPAEGAGTVERTARLTLDVRDDGPGFDTSTLVSSVGLGLAGVREQAELLGGGSAVESSPGAGTHLHVWWPIVGRSDA